MRPPNRSLEPAAAKRRLAITSAPTERQSSLCVELRRTRRGRCPRVCVSAHDNHVMVTMATTAEIYNKMADEDKDKH